MMDPDKCHEYINVCFISSLERLKECRPGTMEWLYLWDTLYNSKKYFEEKYEMEAKDKNG